MGRFELAVTLNHSDSSYTGTKTVQRFARIAIPQNYATNNIPIEWVFTVSESGGGSISENVISYKTNGTQSSEANITFSRNGIRQTASLNLSNATILYVRMYGSTYLSNVGYAYKQWLGSLWLPFGSITSEDIITAAKLNEISAKNNLNTSVTAGNNIILTPWQTIGTAVGVTFDTTKPLKTNLEAVLYETPADWDVQGTALEVGW